MLPKIKKKILFPKGSIETPETDDDVEEEEEEETIYRKQYKVLYRGVIKEFLKTVDPNKLTEMTEEEIDKNVDATLNEHIRVSKLLYAVR